MSTFRHLKIVSSVSAAGALGLAALSGIAHAQSGNLTNLGSSNLGGGAPAVGDVAGAGVGNGVNKGKPIATTSNGKTPAIGVGALSGSPNHNGSVATVSVLNNNRLVGVSNGPVGSNGVNIINPSHGPVLAGATNAAGSTH